MLKLFPERKVSKRKRRKLFLYWFIALILFVAFFANFVRIISFNFYKFAAKPQGPKLTFDKFEGEKITGVILANPLILVNFDPVDSAVEIFELPVNLYLEVGNSGFYLASQTQNLVPSQDQDGVKILANAITANFRLPVDFYLDFGKFEITENKILEFKEKTGQTSSLLWFFQMPVKSAKVLKTNLTLFDQYKLLWQLREVRGDKFNYQKMEPSNFEEIILPDGDKALKVTADGLVPETLSVFQDLKLASEGLTVEVKNAAGEVGLAQKITAICQNIGIAASSSENSDEVLPKSKILVKKGTSDSKTVARLAKTFGGSVENVPDSGFSDVVILAGLDLAERL